jgi:hypothetical protein
MKAAGTLRREVAMSEPSHGVRLASSCSALFLGLLAALECAQHPTYFIPQLRTEDIVADVELVTALLALAAGAPDISYRVSRERGR